MQLLLRLLLIGLALSYIGPVAWAQPEVSIQKKRRHPKRIHGLADSVQLSNPTVVSIPASKTFIIATDRRFFFFNDTHTDDDRPKSVSVFGVRSGFLVRPRHDRKALRGGSDASFKAGAGFYFVNQPLDQPGLLPNVAELTTRHLRVVTVFYERYLFRRKEFELSIPVEAGYGHSRYETQTESTPKREVARGVFIPLGVGVTATYRFPLVSWLRPLHWFGVNLLTGYRFVLKKDMPNSQIDYSGVYISVNLPVSLDKITADIQYWYRKRKQARKIKS